MMPLDRRRQLLLISAKLKGREQLTDQEADYLSEALNNIAHDEDPGKALGTKFGRGQSLSDAEARKNMSVILHMVSALVYDEEDPLPIDVAVETVMPIARALFSEENGDRYDAEYIKKRWYQLKHMQKLDRTFEDPDFPYAPI